MLRLGAQSKRDEAIYKKLVSVSVLCRGKNRFASKQNLSKMKKCKLFCVIRWKAGRKNQKLKQLKKWPTSFVINLETFFKPQGQPFHKKQLKAMQCEK